MTNTGIITAALIVAMGLIAAAAIDNYGYLAAQAMSCEAEGEVFFEARF